MGRGPAAGHGQVLEDHEASTGALAGRLERHRVGDDPDPLALACGDGVALGGCLSGVHGTMVRHRDHHFQFIGFYYQ